MNDLFNKKMEGSIPPPPISMNDISLEFVTPDVAKKFLENQRPNRNTKIRNMSKLINDMSSGKYFVNGSTLVFDKNGRLGDGQHRCNAVIQSGKGQWFIVVKNIPDEAFDTIDVGSARTSGDIMNFAGISNYNVKASIVNSHNIYRHKRFSESSNGKIIKTSGRCIDLSPMAVKNQYLENQAFYDECTVLARRCYERKRLMSIGQLGGIIAFLRCEKKYPQEVVDDFFTQLFMERDARFNVINLLRDALEREKNKITRKGGLYMYKLLIKTWNYYIKGKDVSLLRYQKEEGDIDFLQNV